MKDNANHDFKGKFTPNNNATEVWTAEATMPALQKLWATLIVGHEKVGDNFVKANGIKAIQGVCLM